MSGRSACQRLPLAPLFLLLLPLLSACLPAERALPRQIIVQWPEKQTIYIADERTGGVKAFRIGSGAPVLAAQASLFARSSVRDLKLDIARGQLWVLGHDSVDVHEAEGLLLEKRIPLESRDISTLRLEAGTVVLVSASGKALGRIDTENFLATWHPAQQARPG